MQTLQALPSFFAATPRHLARLMESEGAARPALRGAAVRDTLAAALGLAEKAGITRVADISGLDAAQVPVVSVSRPNARSLSVASGKGLTLLDACASGLVEALELYHAERYAAAVPAGAARGDMLLPDLAALPQKHPASPVAKWSQVTSWARAIEWNTGRAACVPFDLVHADFRPARLAVAQFPVGSNGLAGGNSLREAVLHGLLEVIERDAVARLIADGRDDPLAGRPALDWSSIDVPAVRELRDRLRRHGIEAYVHDATTPIGIPTFYCRLVERDGRRGGLPIATDGSGCHPDPSIALRRALTEAVQTRLLLISGARDDIRARHYVTPPAKSGGLPPISYSWRQASAPGDLQDALQAVRTRLADRGMRQIFVVDLESEAPGLAFVRVIVPGLAAEAPRDGGGMGL
jgi:ribosomal protein S12 methylthiotransferase accessory factor